MQTSKTIFVNIQSLFDLRMGCLIELDVDIALEVTTKKGYYTRDIDRFETSKGVLTRDLMVQMEAPGWGKLLQASMATAMPVFLLELAQRYVAMAATTPYLSAVSITVNTYPFTLDESERTELSQVLQQKLKLNIPIVVVRMSPQEITPVYLHESAIAVIMYEYQDWVNLHQLQIQKKPLKDIAIYVPRLCRELPTPEQLSEFQKHGTDIFRFAQLFYAPLLAFQYLDIAYYCVDNPYNPKGFFHG